MRQGQQNRRGRGRSNNSNSGSNSNSNNNNNNRKPQNSLSRSYESSGPDVKIRGTAAQIAEKYITLARDASSSGDVIMAENYLQHAEHYNRIIMAAQAQQQALPPQQPSIGQYNQEGHMGPQRVSSDANGALRDQPQPVIPALPSDETRLDAAEQPQPVQQNRSGGDVDNRRRRRRYPTNGADRAPVAATQPDGAPAPSTVSAVEITSSKEQPTDEAIA
jgi:hypothetical protein